MNVLCELFPIDYIYWCIHGTTVILLQYIYDYMTTGDESPPPLTEGMKNVKFQSEEWSFFILYEDNKLCLNGKDSLAYNGHELCTISKLFSAIKLRLV